MLSPLSITKDIKLASPKIIPLNRKGLAITKKLFLYGLPANQAHGWQVTAYDDL